MKQLLRVLIVILLLVVAAAIVYTQSQLIAPPAHHLVYEKSGGNASQAVAQIVAQDAKPTALTPSQAQPPAVSMLGTESSPVVVRVAEMPQPDVVERDKDREIQRGIERSLARITAILRAQNFLLLFAAILFFLTLLVLYMLMESVKSFAAAAQSAAEAAKLSAQSATSAATRNTQMRTGPGGMRKFPPHFYRKR